MLTGWMSCPPRSLNSSSNCSCTHAQKRPFQAHHSTLHTPHNYCVRGTSAAGLSCMGVGVLMLTLVMAALSLMTTFFSLPHMPNFSRGTALAKALAHLTTPHHHIPQPQDTRQTRPKRPHRDGGMVRGHGYGRASETPISDYRCKVVVLLEVFLAGCGSELGLLGHGARGRRGRQLRDRRRDGPARTRQLALQTPRDTVRRSYAQTAVGIEPA